MSRLKISLTFFFLFSLINLWPIGYILAQAKVRCSDEWIYDSQKIWIENHTPSKKEENVLMRSSSHYYLVNDDGPKASFVIDSVSSQNARLMFTEGYRLIIYSGNSKEAATLAKEKAYATCGNIDVYMSYKSPMYRVKVGDFTSRLEAKQFWYTYMQKDFPKSTLIQELVFLKKK